MRIQILFFLVFILVSCSDDKETLNKKELLAGTTSREWKIQDYVDVNINWSNQPACIKDDVWIFFSNGDMQQSEGASKCDPADPQIYVNGFWQLNEDTNTLTLIRSSTINWTVDQLTANSLVIKSGTTKVSLIVK